MGSATTLHNMGMIAAAQHAWQQALALLTRSQDMYKAIGLPKDVADEEQWIAQVKRRL